MDFQLVRYNLRGSAIPGGAFKILQIEVHGDSGSLLEPRDPGAAAAPSREAGPIGGQRRYPTRPTARTGRIPNDLVAGAIERTLAEAGEPMRVREIHAAVEDLLGIAVPIPSVNYWLAKSVQDDRPRLRDSGTDGIGC